MLNNPFKAHIRESDGTYRVAKLGFLGWSYLDVHDPLFMWWPTLFRPLNRWVDFSNLKEAKARLTWYIKSTQVKKFKRVM